MNSKGKAYLIAFIAFILFGSTSLVVKPSILTSVDLVFYRMAITAITTFSFLVINKQSFKNLTPMSLLSSIATSAAIFLNMVCLFSSFKLAPVSMCVAIFYSGPIFTIIIRRFVFRTQIHRANAISSLISIVAILLLLTQPTAASSNQLGYLLALLGGILFGLIPIIEQGTKVLSPSLSLFIQSLFAAFCLIPFSVNSFALINISELTGIIVLGVLFTLTPFLLWWRALRLNHELSPFVSYVDPLTAVLISLFVMNEPLSLKQEISAVMLGIAAIFPLIEKRFSMIFKKRLAFLIVFFFISQVQAANKEPLHIYVPGSYTGIMPFLAKGISLAVIAFAKETNEHGGLLGRNIEVISQDDKAQVVVAAKNAQVALADRNHLLTIGHSFSSVALPIGRMYQESGKLFVTPNATNVEISKLKGTVFQLSWNDDFQAAMLVNIVTSRFKPRKVLVLTNRSDPYSDGLSTTFLKILKIKTKIIEIQQYDYLSDRIDFGQLFNSMRSFEPDLVFIPDLKPRVAEILRALNEQGFGQLTYLGADGWGPTDGRPDIFFLEGKKPQGNNYYYIHRWHPKMVTQKKSVLTKRFEKLTGKLPSYISDGPDILPYAFLIHLRSLIEKYQTVDNLLLSKKLRGSSYIDTTGKVTFENDGSTSRNMVLLELMTKGLRLDSLVSPTTITSWKGYATR